MKMMRNKLMGLGNPSPWRLRHFLNSTSLQIQSLHPYTKLFKSSSSSLSQRRSLSLGASLSSNMDPPIAKKVKHEMEMFGDVRIDNYYWLRDDSRSDPQILAYLREENAYTDHLMSGLFNYALTASLVTGFSFCFFVEDVSLL